MAGEAGTQENVRRQSEGTHSTDDHEWPRDVFGQPMLRVSVSRAELVPTVQYGTCTVGPAQVVGFSADGPDESIKGALRRLRKIVEDIISEDRQTLVLEIQARAAAGQPVR